MGFRGVGGDLAGSLPNPVVTGIEGEHVAVSPGGTGAYLRADGTWATPTGTAAPAATVVGPDAFGAASAVGASALYARGDHDHGLPAAPAVPGPAATVTGPDAFGAASAVGVLGSFAREDHDHGLPAASGAGLGVYGDGSNGTVVFDGAATILGLVPVANVYTLTRDVFCAGITINAGVSIVTNGYRIFCSGTLTNNGTIQWDGNAGGNNGAAAGAALTNNNGTINTGQFSKAGGAGIAGGGANGTNASSSNGGAGGAGGNGSAGVGGIGGTVQTPLANESDIRFLPFAVLGFIISIAQGGAVGVIGGAGGGGGTGDNSNNAGSGGSGGGCIIIAAHLIAGAGNIHARGGAGGNATVGNSGGGGGGGGGWVTIVSSSVIAGAVAGQNIDANGGAGGALHGTGVNGTAGGNGKIILVSN